MDMHMQSVYSMIHAQSDAQQLANLNRLADFTICLKMRYHTRPITTVYCSWYPGSMVVSQSRISWQHTHRISLR